MNGYEYICKTAAQFRKKFPDCYERKEDKPVFIDANFLNKIEDIPTEIKTQLIEKSRVKRLCADDFAISVEDENGYEYWLDIECDCYDYYKNDKLIYSVLAVVGARWSTYKANIYGYYDGLPVKSGDLNWSTRIYNRLERIEIDNYETEVD